jgi:phenylpropionate dioxygenase-like ring-hydroxylating dioxygenase large terminal subunit
MLVTQQPVLRRFWYAIMPMSHLDQGPKPFTLLGEKIVLWRKPDGSPAALRDRCCHRTAQLSKGFVEGENLVCGYHGWTYNASGACVRIPQQDSQNIPNGACVPAYRAQEKYGYAWVALDEPLKPIPDFPEDGSGRHRRIFQFYEEWKTSPVRMMENSFDNSHFSFVHKSNFGLFDQPKPASYEFRDTDYGFEAQTLVPVRNPPESFKITGTTEPITNRQLINRYYLPFSRRFGCHYPASGIDHIIYNCATPIDDERMMLVQWLYRSDKEEDCSEQSLIQWDALITAEDRDILEATDPDVCIDIRRRVEFHMPSDRPGLVIRKQLLELLQAHGEQEVFRG